MSGEIVTHAVPTPALWREPRFLIDELEKRGHGGCIVQFGFAWAEEFYPSAEWGDVPLSGLKLLAEVKPQRFRSSY